MFSSIFVCKTVWSDIRLYMKGVVRWQLYALVGGDG